MKWMAETLLSFDVCLCVCAQRTGKSDQFKTVKATDFKFNISHGQSEYDPLKIFQKGAWPVSRDP